MKKKLHMLKKNFHHILKNEKTMFILIFTGMVIGYTTFILVSGVLSSQMKIQNTSSSYNSISIIFNNENNEEQIIEFLDEEPLGELYNALLIDFGNKGVNVIGWKGIDFKRWHAMDSGSSFFTLVESESDEDIAIISKDLSEPGTETFLFNNVEYHIVDQCFLAFYMFIKELPIEMDYYVDESGVSNSVILPYKTFIGNGFNVDVIRLDIVDSIHIDKASNMEKLQSYFEGQEIYFSDNVYQDEEQIRRAALVRLLFAGLCVLALINIFSLFNYWIKNNKNQYFIYGFCGASSVTIFILIALEWFIINFCSFLLSITLVLFLKPLLEILNTNIQLSFIENTILLLMGFTLSFLFSLKTVFRISTVMNTFEKKEDI